MSQAMGDRDPSAQKLYTANRLVEEARAERDRYREALADAANDIKAIHDAGFDSLRRGLAEAALNRIREALDATTGRETR